jgi:hypothetical protein
MHARAAQTVFLGPLIAEVFITQQFVRMSRPLLEDAGRGIVCPGLLPLELVGVVAGVDPPLLGPRGQEQPVAQRLGLSTG